MGKTLYLECNAGISGDMTVAALLDLGADKEKLEKALASLPLEGYKVHISRVTKAGLDACDFAVELAEENFDRDMEYLHGHDSFRGHNHNHQHDHDHEGGHSHHEDEHGHPHEHQHGHHNHKHNHYQHGNHDDQKHGHHVHRGLEDIKKIIGAGQLTDGAKALTVRIFEILAQGESKAHGLPMDQVHFHEVGAVDSIVDIVAAAVCFDDLQIEEVIIPKLCEGQGTVRAQHGILPIPVPATANIAAAHHLPLEIVAVKGELVTPTGAAIAAAVSTGGQLPSAFTIEKIGIGAGKRQYKRPSLLRAMFIKEVPQNISKKQEDCAENVDDENAKDGIIRIETNVDDVSGEILGRVMDQLLKAGANDVHFVPVFMKKNRPATEIVVLCDEELLPKMGEILLMETSTIGIRWQKMKRWMLPRKIETEETSMGSVQVKVVQLPDGSFRKYPEYGSVNRLAKSNKKSYYETHMQILKEV